MIGIRAAEGVEIFEFTANLIGGPGAIHPVLIWDQDTVILVDAGFPGQASKLREAIEQVGVTFARIDRIIMTHHDIDHIGGLAALVNESPHQIEVIAHAEEKPYIQGELAPIKLTQERIAQMEEQLSRLPEQARRAIKSTFENFSRFCTTVTRTVVDGEELPYCGGITVIHTPGHTPGHISLYLRRSQILIAGDALFIEDGQLVPAPSYINHDPAEAIRSLKELTRFDIEAVVCYHGGISRDNPNQRLSELALG